MNKVCMLLLLLITSSTSVIYAQSKAEKYQEIINDAQRNGIPGIVALVQSPNEKEWRGKAGVNNIEHLTTLSIDQSFRIASISKIFTSIIILQLIDEKKLTLSDPISKYLGEETIDKIPYINKINILHLLSHSSGIYSFSENNRFWKECYFNGGMSRLWSPNELVSYIENKKPTSKPVEPYSEKFYSNTNYILLGMIIEKVTGHTLSDEYQKRIFTPLRMNYTFLEGYDDQGRKPIDSYAIPNSFFLRSAMKRQKIEKVKESELINLSQKYSQFNSWAWSAGGISSNINDLSVFLSALRNGELLSNDSQKTLLKLNSSKDKGINFFGGTGGSDGIQATMLHLMPSDIVIIILINASGQKEVNLSSIFVQLFKMASNKK